MRDKYFKAGVSGTSGTSGIDGTSGVSGTSGIDGTSGVNGTSGIDGTSGVSGTSGIDGTSGVNGTSGIDGTSGVSGTSGIDGNDGTSGIDGTSGVSVSFDCNDLLGCTDFTDLQTDVTDLEEMVYFGPGVCNNSFNYFTATPFSVALVTRLLPNNQQNLILNPIFIGDNMVIERLRLEVTVAQASSNFRILIYDADNYNLPLNKIYESGNLSSATTGFRTITGLSINLSKGKVYYLGYHCNHNNVEVASIPRDFCYALTSVAVNVQGNTCYRVNVPFGSAPATISSILNYGGVNATAIQLMRATLF